MNGTPGTPRRGVSVNSIERRADFAPGGSAGAETARVSVIDHSFRLSVAVAGSLARSSTRWGIALLLPLGLPLVGWGANELARWTFEQSKPVGAGPLRPESGYGTATGQTGGMWTNPVGNGSGESWSGSQWSGGDFFQFTVEAEGNSFFDLTWSHISSSTGPRDFAVSYSLDGVNFVWLADYEAMANVTPNNWSYGATIDGSRYGCELQFDHPVRGRIHFRITCVSYVAANSGSLAPGGASRLDDFSVSAETR